MHEGKFIFSQLMAHLLWKSFQRCVRRYQGDHKVQSLYCSQQYRAMALGQLNRRSSLRELVVYLRAHQDKWYLTPALELPKTMRKSLTRGRHSNSE